MNKHVIKKNLQAVMLEVTYRKTTYASLAIFLTLSAWMIASGIASIAASDTSAAETSNTSFQVNVQDSISVAVTAPVSGATGNAGEFLRNTVNIAVNTNVSNGFTASMYSRDNTNLIHTILGTSYYIPTMSSRIRRYSFGGNSWGYSLKSASLDGKTYGETDEGNFNSYYYPLTDSTTAPIKVLVANAGTKSQTQSIYFGAKAGEDKPAGTYSNTVVISVVTGTINSGTNPTNPITPTNPVTPGTDPNPNDTNPVYTGSNTTAGTGISGSNGTTVRTVRVTNSDTTTTTTEVSAGDNTGSYAPAQGVSVTTQSNIVEGDSSLPIGLAATSVATATAGLIFFILAKRDEDDDEEEDLI